MNTPPHCWVPHQRLWTNKRSNTGRAEALRLPHGRRRDFCLGLFRGGEASAAWRQTKYRPARCHSSSFVSFLFGRSITALPSGQSARLTPKTAKSGPDSTDLFDDGSYRRSVSRRCAARERQDKRIKNRCSADAYFSRRPRSHDRRGFAIIQFVCHTVNRAKNVFLLATGSGHYV